MAVAEATQSQRTCWCGSTEFRERDGACAECDRRRKRGFYAPRDLGWTAVDQAPDHRVAVQLRCELARDRRAYGRPFDEVWSLAVEFVLSPLRYADRISWKAAFEATKDAWRAAYERQPGPGIPNPLADGTLQAS
jgi:hypothetical protein